MPRQQLMFLALDTLSDIEYEFPDDRHPIIFSVDTVDNALDADDPEVALHDYYRMVGAK